MYGTVTLTGTVAADVMLLVSVTTAPPLGAGPVRVTVPVEVFPLPPFTLGGLNPSEVSAGGFTVRVSVLVTPPSLTEMVTVVELDTGLVFTGKVKVVLPWSTAISETVAAALLLLLAFSTVPAGAGPFSVTVPLEGVPPITLEGLIEIEATNGLTVKVSDLVTAL